MIHFAFAGFRHSHIHSLYHSVQKSPTAQTVGAFEEHPQARQEAAEALDLRFTHESYDSLIHDPGIDVIAIGDYYGIRGARVIEALKAGKHVMVDKPLCTSLDELDQIETLVKKNGLCVGMMLGMKNGKTIQAVKKMLENDELGTVHAIFFSGQHPLLYGTRPNWYFEEGKHGGTINDIAIHGIDTLHYMTGMSVKRITAARCWNAFATEEPSFLDAAQFIVELDNGAGLMADVSYAAPDSCGYKLPQYWRFTIWGTKGMVEFKSGSDQIMIAKNGDDDIHPFTSPNVATINYLDAFIDEITGKRVHSGTEQNLNSTRQTLWIQSYADQQA